MNLLTIILVVLFAIWLGVYIARRDDCSDDTNVDADGEDECKSDNKQTEQKNLSKRQILEFLQDPSNSSGQVTNNDVEALLGVSDATATRYMHELEQDGEVRQIGTTGKGVYYIKSSQSHE